MRLFAMVGFMLLLIGGLLLSPMSASAPVQNQYEWQSSIQANIEAFAGASTGVDTKKVLVQDWMIDDSFSQTLLQPIDKAAMQAKLQGKLKGNHLTHTEPTGSEYAPLVSQRFMSFAQHERLHSRPDYQFAFEFTSPPVPSLTVGYRMDSTPAVDWQLHVGGSSFRLSAWKESNLLYRLSHTRSA
ncbi:Conserved hypothetical protein [Shewanella piezotolerans WP3]|uniref:Orphan protein n=1 Tax=Shewanella piezotolerans (strain WP3 / JCM 13877) TaxID=225849 RepID=B8CKG1_SHEPW|nr:hypothetical protein [Shewanella piezotolerans]ACJ28000.1 Conserved hypothetical protein [Shewanella piezotolerans WP3]